MSYQGETAERALQALLQTYLPAALDAVEARWAGITPIALPEPANWTRGYRMWMLNLPGTDYPYITTIVAQANPREQPGRLEATDESYDFLIAAFIVADAEDEAVDVAHRYAEAIVDVLESHRVIGAEPNRFRLSTDKPQVRIIADNQTHKKAGKVGDSYKAADVDYLRLAEVQGALLG